MTELSKFGIKLGQLYSYISSSTVDFMKITDNFKEQSHMLVIELSNLLDSVTPSRFREIISEIKEEESSIDVHFKKTNTEILETTEIEKINFDDELRKNEQLKKEIVYLVDLVMQTDFMGLKGVYGGATSHQRYYPHVLVVRLGGKEKRVVYQSFPGALPMPEAFRRVRDELFNLVDRKMFNKNSSGTWPLFLRSLLS